MTAVESTNAHGDAHAAALLRTRKRAALAAWNEAVAQWRREGCPHPPLSEKSDDLLGRFAARVWSIYQGGVADIVSGPAAVAGGH